MTESDDPLGVRERLYSAMKSDEPTGSSRLDSADLRWFREAYEAEVATSVEVRVPASIEPEVALAREAVTAVLGDVHRTTSLRPEVVVDVWSDDVIRISINNGWTTPSMMQSERPAAFAEVADYFQDQLASELGCWPVCERHDLGLHAEVHHGVAIWWCRRFQHEVARVGSLGETGRARQRTKRP